jgi:hypothetical protein
MPAEKGCGCMVRQCAWCLRLIDSAGERLSPLPVPKLYEASHGICGICGVQWMEQVIAADDPQGVRQRHEVDATGGSGSGKVLQEMGSHESITQMVLQLQERSSETAIKSRPLSSKKMHMR